MEAASAALASANYASGMPADRYITWDAWDEAREARAAERWASGALSAFSPRGQHVGAAPSDRKALGRALARMITAGRRICGLRRVP